MLRYFFDITERERSAALFRGLNIENSPHYARRGASPVIFLTLKDLKSPTWAGMLAKLNIKIAILCEQYQILAPNLEGRTARFFEDALNAKLDTDRLALSLQMLSQILCTHYEEKTIILIDEYDAPLLDAYEFGYYDEAITFFRVFLGSALKTNPHLGFAVLTGILRVSKESLFSGLNNVRVCSIIDYQFVDKFGFTDSEVEALHNTQSERLKMAPMISMQGMRMWYDGYSFGNNIKQLEIYNPWSVLCALSTLQLKAHWVNTSQDMLINIVLKKHIDTALPIIEKLINGESIPIQLNESAVLKSMQENATLDELWSLLFFSGDLTLATPPDSRNLCDVRMPNMEIRDSYRNTLQSIIETGA